MLEKDIGYKAVFTAWINMEQKQEHLTDDGWTIVEIMNNFFKTVYLATCFIYVVYTRTSNLA